MCWKRGSLVQKWVYFSSTDTQLDTVWLTWPLNQYVYAYLHHVLFCMKLLGSSQLNWSSYTVMLVFLLSSMTTHVHVHNVRTLYTTNNCSLTNGDHSSLQVSRHLPLNGLFNVVLANLVERAPSEITLRGVGLLDLHGVITGCKPWL